MAYCDIKGECISPRKVMLEKLYSRNPTYQSIEHRGVNKIYADMKDFFFWTEMKKDMVKLIAMFLEC